jgi:hypothetical protein
MVSGANHLTDCAVQHHASCHGVRRVQPMRNHVIVSGANDLTAYARQCRGVVTAALHPGRSMPYSEIPPGACPELRRRGQDDTAVRWGTLRCGLRWCAARCLPEHALSCAEGVSVTWRFIVKTSEEHRHGERSEPSHRLDSAIRCTASSCQDDTAVRWGTRCRGMRWCTARSLPPVRMTRRFVGVRGVMERCDIPTHEKPCSPMKNHVIVSGANDLTDWATPCSVSSSRQCDMAVYCGTLRCGLHCCAARSLPPVRMTWMFVGVRCARECDGVQRDPSRSMP